MMALGPQVKVRGFFMRLIRVADLRPRCIAIALGLIRIIGSAIRPSQDMCRGFRCYGNQRSASGWTVSAGFHL
jgi:hypothetical protein